MYLFPAGSWIHSTYMLQKLKCSWTSNWRSTSVNMHDETASSLHLYAFEYSMQMR